MIIIIIGLKDSREIIYLEEILRELVLIYPVQSKLFKTYNFIISFK